MKRIVIYIIGVLSVLMAEAQTTFRTSELKRLATELKIDTGQLQEGYNYPVAKDLNLTVHMQNNMIDHIGLHLFSEDIRKMDRSSVFDFLERYFLQLKYPPTIKTAEMMIRNDGFRFEYGSMQTLTALRSSDSFSYQYDKRRYKAQWRREGHELLTVSFPVEYQLISGENKIEAESHVLNDIQQTTVVADEVPADKNSKGDTYIMKQFSSRLYYMGRKLVANSRYPAETAANMMLSTETKGDYQLNMTQVSYGFKKSVVEVGLKQWITFCRNNGCKLYFGTENVDKKGNVEAVVIAVNEAENYNHVLTISIPVKVMELQQGTIEARLYPYVPTQNVQSLFGTYRKSNPKTYVSK